jgi:Tfp pilus assembly protein PilX
MSKLRRRGASQDGFVMVITMMLLTVTLLVAGVAISDTVTARSYSDTNRRGDAAQQAADAGLQIAMYRANQMKLNTTDFNSGLSGIANTLGCLVPLTVSGSVTSFTTVALGASLSCPSSQGPAGGGCTNPCWNYETLGNRTKVATLFIPAQTSTGPSSTSGHGSLNPVIVSIGRETNGTATTSDDVIRRVEAILNPVDPFNMIEATGNLSFPGLITTFNGDVRTDGNLNVALLGSIVGVNIGSGSPFLRLANVQYRAKTGLGLLTIANATQITAASPSFTRAAVAISPTKHDCGAATGEGSCTPLGTSYSALTHKLTVTSGQSVTLGSGDYVFCGVSVVGPSGFLNSVPGGTLQTSASASAPTRIFIDSPSSARCNGVSPSNPVLNLQGNLNTVSTTPSAMQIYIADNGSGGYSSASIDASLTSTLTPAFFFYAPDTNLTMKAGAVFEGNIIGHDVTFTNSLATTFTQDLGLSNLPLSSTIGVFTRKQYVQCANNEPVITAATVLDAYKDC